jgi:hypothetical protein
MLKRGRDDCDRSALPQKREQETGVYAGAFDHWLDRELRLIRLALSEPVQSDLIALIQDHRKITR